MGYDIKSDEDLLKYNKNILRKKDPANTLLKVETEGKACILCGELFKAVGNTRICSYCRHDSTAQYLYNEKRRKPRPKNRVGTLECTISDENKKTGKCDVEYIYTLPNERINILSPDMDVITEKNNLLQYLSDMIVKNRLFEISGTRIWAIYLKTCICGCNSSFLTINNSHRYKPDCYETKERIRLNKLYKIKKQLKVMTLDEMREYGKLDGHGPVGVKGTILCSSHRKDSDEEEIEDIKRMKKQLDL